MPTIIKNNNCNMARNNDSCQRRNTKNKDKFIHSKQISMIVMLESMSSFFC